MITNGELNPDDKILSENKLKKRYKVSSITVIKALNELIKDGYIYRSQGKGSFVSKHRKKRRVRVTENIKGGKKQHSKILSTKQIVNEKIANHMGLPCSQKIILIERIRFIDGSPFAFQKSWFPKCFLSLEEVKKFKPNESIYKYVKYSKNINMYNLYSKESYSLRLLKDKRLTDMLYIDPDTPVFFVKKTSYHPEGYPLEYIETIINNKNFTLDIETN